FMPHAPSTTVFATLFLHDALPISPSWTAAPPTGTPPCKDLSGARAVLRSVRPRAALHPASAPRPHRGSTLPSPLRSGPAGGRRPDRKSTRLNSSHVKISYAVFCLK